MRELAAAAFTAAGCSGLARADFFVDGETVLLNEINTLPGFTATSVYGQLWAASGVAYPDLVTRLCEIAIERFAGERAAEVLMFRSYIAARATTSDVTRTDDLRQLHLCPPGGSFSIQIR